MIGQEKTSRPKRLFKVLLALAALFVVGAGVAAYHWQTCLKLLLYSRPIRYDQQSLQSTIARADRMVIREGGFDCCHGTGNDAVLLTITNINEIRNFAAHLRFKPVSTTNSLLESCLCCGFPGIDWYAGRQRLALTSVQHGKYLRWQGFSTARVLGKQVGYGDAPLTDDSADWLRIWMTIKKLPRDEPFPGRPGGARKRNP